MSIPAVVRITNSNGPKVVRILPPGVGLPQPLGVTASPTFVGLSLSGRSGNVNSLAIFGASGAINALPLGSGLAIIDGALTATGTGPGSGPTNLSIINRTAIGLDIASSTGNDAPLPLATDQLAGLESAADKAKLDSIIVDSARIIRIPVRNNSGVTIPKGSPCYQTSSSGTTITVALADASVEETASQTLGLAEAEIPNNSNGILIERGLLDGLNTSTLTEGKTVWLSETAGALTTTRPTQPAHGVICGSCIKQGAGTSGILYVRVSNGQELYELHDVLISGEPDGQAQVLRRFADGLWKNSVLLPGDVGAATAAQGSLAATAVQPAELASTLSSYLTIANGALTYQPLDGDLTAIAGLSTTTYGRSFLALANAAAGRAWLELGTAATASTGDFATPAALTTGLAGKADLVGGVVPTSQIPAIALVQYLGQVSSQAAMLALRGQGGDWCIRTDGGASEWVIVANDGSSLTDWVQMPSGTAGVTSINGQTGAVTLGTGDLAESGGNLFFSATRAIASTLAGFTAGAGTVSDSDTILQALQKVVGNITSRALAGLINSSGLTMAAGRLVGRSTAGTGAVEEIIIGTGLSFNGNTLNATGGGPAAGLVRIDTASTANTIYVGKAPAGTDESATGWTILRTTFTVLGVKLTGPLTATGAYANRTSLTYS
jgi:hypothetical protein